MARQRKYSIVLYGATGFTGKLTAAYLDTHPELQSERWAIAGRNKAALDAVRDTLSSSAVDVIVCPLDDPEVVDAMVKSTRVVITAAGPYSSYSGDSLLGACARTGTHYADLSGEGFWQREMIEQFHEVAKAGGAKIILGGGVDSIPSDLGAYLAINALGCKPGSDETIQVTGVYTEYSGSFSGGTLASGRAYAKAIKTGRLSPEAQHDPYLLAPGVTGLDSAVATLSGMPRAYRVQVDETYGLLLPFFMAGINAPVVRRSLALRKLAASVSYRECCSAGMWGRALWLYSSRGFGYPLLEPIKFAPKSGEGPPRWMIKQGAFKVEVTAKTSNGLSVTTVVAGKGDPGYGATSKMLAEVGLCLLAEHNEKPTAAGVLTPSTALGSALVDRLASAEDGNFMQLTLASGSRAS